MIQFLRDRLGHLEMKVLEILWAQGDSSVHEVLRSMDRPLAYTTIMTTLDRLFKKGVLERRRSERAFIYKPRLTRLQWEQQHAGDLVSRFLSGPRRSGELLMSCLVEAVCQQDESLLDDLERKIKLKRRELSRKRAS